MPLRARKDERVLTFESSFLILCSVLILENRSLLSAASMSSFLAAESRDDGSVYLQHGGSQLQAHQHGPVHHLSDPGVGHLQRVLHQVRDVHLPVGPQHGDDLVGALRGGGVELGQHLHQGPLVLQRAASAQAPLVLLLVRVAVSGAPGTETNRGDHSDRTETPRTSIYGLSEIQTGGTADGESGGKFGSITQRCVQSGTGHQKGLKSPNKAFKPVSLIIPVCSLNPAAQFWRDATAPFVPSDL